MKKNLIRIKQFFVPFAIIFIAYSFSGAYFSDRGSALNNTFTAGVWTVTPTPTPESTPEAYVAQPGDIVINELMINPSGDEDAVKPDGEWVELFNKTVNEIDLSQWQLVDASDHSLPILAGNTKTGSTKIPANGYLVVYRNGYSFSLNNGDETVSLINDTVPGQTIDTYSYTLNTQVDKTWGRLPSGSATWQKNLNPSIGGPNV